MPEREDSVMLKRYTSVRQMKKLSFFCCLAYFMSYMTRLNYAACMVEIQRTLGIGKDTAGLPVTACFLSYGIGQLLFGYLGDKLRPQRMITWGLAGSAACNILAALFPRIEWIIPVWCANGFFQSMLWPPLVRIMAEVLDDEWYRKCCVLVSVSSSAATVAVYLIAPACIRWAGWRLLFFMAAAAGFATALAWACHTRTLETVQVSETDLSKKRKNGGDESVSSAPRLLSLVPFASILPAIILHGMLRDGITTWMPGYMAETFDMSTSGSILSAAVLPVCGVVSTLLSSLLLYRMKNELSAGACLFGAGALACLFMLPVYDMFPAVCILMMTLITGCMYGVNLMLISRVPGHFAEFGNVSTISGILNAATYVGSSLSTYAFGAVAERAGWQPVVAVWLAVALGGTLLLLAGMRKWGRFCRRETRPQ